MRVTNLLAVAAFLGSAAQARPFNHALHDGETKEFLQVPHVGGQALETNGNGAEVITKHAYNDSSAPEKRSPFFRTPMTMPTTALKGDIQLAVINATPYRWRRVHAHSYQLNGWGKKEKTNWPDFINPGQAYQYLVVNEAGDAFKWISNHDDAGEVIYKLEGTKKPMAFEIRYRKTGEQTFNIHVQFREELTTKTSKKGDKILIADQTTAHLPMYVSASRAGCSFHIAGKEGDFTSTTDWWNPPGGGWMQDLLPAIGDHLLREIVMPRSHHAALDTTDEGHELVGASVAAGQSVTQSRTLRQQLSAEGVRILDERVYYSNKKGFIHAHMSPDQKTGYRAGSYGRPLLDTIDAINEFQDANPGEFIIWDFHDQTYNFDKNNADFDLKLRKKLYDTLKKGLKHLAHLPDVNDYTNLTLNELIGNGTSAVICRFNNWEGVPGPEDGFVTTNNFRVNDHWSAMYNPGEVFNDQLRHLKENAHRHGIAHGMQYLRSLGKGDLYLPSNMGLVEMARELMVSFRVPLWRELSHDKYPNWLTMDGFEGGEVKGFIIAMNKCFVAGQCGDWTKR